MLNLAPLAGTAGHIARVAMRKLLTIILAAVGLMASAVLHEVVKPICEAVMSAAGIWLPVLVTAAIVIVFVLERTRNLKL